MKYISIHRFDGIYVYVMSLIMFNLSVLMHAARANEYMLLRLGAVSK